MNQICFVTNKYPNLIEPNALVFLQQLVWSIADTGIKCTVICPVPVNINLKYFKLPDRTSEETEHNSTVDIFYPKYVGFGQSDIAGINPAQITTMLFKKTVRSVLKKMICKPDILYGHFITPAGITVASLGKQYNIKSVLAYGEATLATIDHFGLSNTRSALKYIDGVIAVSQKNKDALVGNKIVHYDKIKVVPNGYREERFFKINKNESRKKLNLPIDKFIVAFVGSFDTRKGIDRLSKAVAECPEVYAIYGGKGNIEPNTERCLFKGQVAHEKLTCFYSAADVFVLPTLNEGCCNAIIEAMACGLPIISSSYNFNDEILNESNSIRVDPNNVQEIINAIKLLQSDIALRKKLSEGSIRKAKMLTLTKRADVIIDYLGEILSI